VLTKKDQWVGEATTRAGITYEYWTAEQADHSIGILKQHYREVVSKEEALKYWEIVPQ
jgi:hypothetical protein